MIVQVKDLPESARKPLLVALSLQALATAATSSGAKEVAVDRLARFSRDFAAIVREARDDGWVEDTLTTELADHAAPTRLKEVADRLWTVGLARLQQLVAAGEWYPDELDLVIKPREEPLLARDHVGLIARRRDGGGKLGFGPAT
jgi:hypothetical protein